MGGKEKTSTKRTDRLNIMINKWEIKVDKLKYCSTRIKSAKTQIDNNANNKITALDCIERKMNKCFFRTHGRWAEKFISFALIQLNVDYSCAFLIEFLPSVECFCGFYCLVFHLSHFIFRVSWAGVRFSLFMCSYTIWECVGDGVQLF